jgi:hypothetical protein
VIAMLWYFNRKSLNELIDKTHIILSTYNATKIVRQSDNRWLVSTSFGNFYYNNVELKHELIQYSNLYRCYDKDNNELRLKLFGGVKVIT